MIKEIKDWGSQNIKPKTGTFPPKPADARSLVRWLEAGKVPIDYTKVTYFAMSTPNQGYGYYLENEVRDMTPEERSEFIEMSANKSGGAQLSLLDNAPRVQGKEPGKNWVYQNMSRYTKKTIIALDVESTGFYNSDELLQLSIVGVKDTKFNSYLKPHKKKSWIPAMKINHITPEMVANAPYPEDVREQVQKIIDEADFIAGFNINFDIRMLKNCMGIIIPEEKVIDVMKIFKLDEPGLPNHKLADAVELYAADHIKSEYTSGAHDSLFDTKATLHVLIQQYRLHINGELAYENSRKQV